MATAEEYAQWIVDNQDQQGSDEFNTVAQAYEMAKQQMTQTAPAKEFGVKEAVQTALPAITPSGPTGMGQMVKDVGGAVSPYAKGAVNAATAGYKAHPLLTAAIDTVGLGTVGAPIATTYSSVMGAADQYDRLKSAGNQVGKVLSNTPGNPVNYFAMGQAIPEAAPILKDLYDNKGGPNAIKAWLQSPEAAQYMKDPKFAAAAEQYAGKVPGMGAQAMKVAGPLLRGAAKVAGPVGLGMNMYDAGKYARESQLGTRLATGQGQQAEQAFRQRNTTYGAPVTPDQAAAVLENGSARDIQALGGQESLNMAIRLKAAKKVLGR